jgi:hypothetical protein
VPVGSALLSFSRRFRAGDVPEALAVANTERMAALEELDRRMLEVVRGLLTVRQRAGVLEI